MTFKQFQRWCNDRACDGCWGYKEALLCIEVLDDINQLPFWRRKKAWREIEDRIVEAIINPINQKIKEVRADHEST